MVSPQAVEHVEFEVWQRADSGQEALSMKVEHQRPRCLSNH